MTTFVDAGAVAGRQFLPRDGELLALPGWRVAELDDANDLLDIVGAARRRRAAADAMEARAIARLVELRAADDSHVPKEVALELRISDAAAADRVTTSTALVNRMPLVLAAMQDGEFEGYLASRLTHATRALSDAEAWNVDRQLAGKLATGQVTGNDPKNVTAACRRLVIKVNPQAATRRARIARCERKVQLVPGEDTMSRIIGDLPAEVAASAYARVDRIARRLRNNGDQRTLDQLRADVFGDLLTGTHTDTSDTGAEGAGSAGAMVYLHMPIDTALAMRDDGAELTGYGPIPGPIARDIMTRKNSVLRKLLVDPGTGKIEGLGRRRYRPNQALRDLIIARDRECCWCHRPAQFCDIDHLGEWAKHHGTTDPENLGAKCEREHYLRDAEGWDLHVDPDTGTATITTPAGRTYTRHRHPIIEPQPPPSKPEPLPDEPLF